MALINKKKLEDLGQMVANAAQSGVAKSKQLAEIAKLKASNLSEEESIKKAYMEIGKLYYAERGSAPEGAYVALCSRISKAKDNIEDNNGRIQDIKTDDVPDYEDTVWSEVEEPAPAEVPAEEAAAEEPVIVAEEPEPSAEPVEDEIPDEE